MGTARCAAECARTAASKEAIGTDDSPRKGLRERKKEKTRSLIQEHAIRLFNEQGYDATSIEQIADAAEVSPSTVFRYFAAKSDLVMYDDFDAVMVAAFRAQPAELSTVEALRAAFASIFSTEGSDSVALQYARQHLIRTVPELRAAALDDAARTLYEVAELVAERAQRPVDDEVLALAGAVIGVAISAWFASDEQDWMERLGERLDTGLRLLATGFRM